MSDVAATVWALGLSAPCELDLDQAEARLGEDSRERRASNRPPLGVKLRSIPRGARPLTNFAIGDTQWASLGLHADLAAFFFRAPSRAVHVLQPSPGGAVEPSLPLPLWRELVAGHPAIAKMAPGID